MYQSIIGNYLRLQSFQVLIVMLNSLDFNTFETFSLNRQKTIATKIYYIMSKTLLATNE